MKDCGPAVFFAGAHGRLAAFLIEIGDHHCGTLTGEANRGRTAHPAGSASYHCDFMVESTHLRSPYIELHTMNPNVIALCRSLRVIKKRPRALRTPRPS
jgi:hypothetical protein